MLHAPATRRSLTSTQMAHTHTPLLQAPLAHTVLSQTCLPHTTLAAGSSSPHSSSTDSSLTHTYTSTSSTQNFFPHQTFPHHYVTCSAFTQNSFINTFFHIKSFNRSSCTHMRARSFTYPCNSSTRSFVTRKSFTDASGAQSALNPPLCLSCLFPSHFSRERLSEGFF